ncbi:MAG: putative mobilization protein [Burkholderiaceae bacterium]|nr:putative mobilization protein [Burkholderiaceae bacterium]
MSEIDASQTARRLERVVSFRLSAADHAEYEKLIAASSLRPSEFFRSVILNHQVEIVVRKADATSIKRLLFLSNKISNNLNQIARRLNADNLAGVISEQTYRLALEELHSISFFMKAYLDDVD